MAPRINLFNFINLKSDGWDTEPFQLTEIDGKLFGRGSTDDKVVTLFYTNKNQYNNIFICLRDLSWAGLMWSKHIKL